MKTAYYIILMIIFILAQVIMGAAVFGQDRELFDALHAKEASSRLYPPDGDGGRAIGPYQIWYAYWFDAQEHQPGLALEGYQACRRKDYAEAVMTAYWDRYKLRTRQQRARGHNGGPGGPRSNATSGYWGDVRALLARRFAQTGQ